MSITLSMRSMPVIFLTSKDEEPDEALGLAMGADDYITKPFNHLELLARVRAVLRRLDMPAPNSCRMSDTRWTAASE